MHFGRSKMPYTEDGLCQEFIRTRKFVGFFFICVSMFCLRFHFLLDQPPPPPTFPPEKFASQAHKVSALCITSESDARPRAYN